MFRGHFAKVLRLVKEGDIIIKLRKGRQHNSVADFPKEMSVLTAISLRCMFNEYPVEFLRCKPYNMLSLYIIKRSLLLKPNFIEIRSCAY